MLEGQTYNAVCRNFRWKIPETYNIGVDICDKWADGTKRLSLIYVGPDEKEHRYSFQDLKALSNKLANALGPMVRKKETVLEYCSPNVRKR